MCQNILKFILLIKISKQFKRHISVLSERSHSLFQEIFLTQGSNPSFLHCRQILYCLSRQRSPVCRKKYSETRNLEMKLPPHIYKNPRFRWHALFCISVDALWEESFVFSVFHLLKLLGLPINLCKTLWKKNGNKYEDIRPVVLNTSLCLFIVHWFICVMTEFLGVGRVRDLGVSQRGPRVPAHSCLHTYYITAVLPFCVI